MEDEAKLEKYCKKKISTVFFDLDGTLLPMNNDEFTKEYLILLSNKLRPLGYNPELLIDGIWYGVSAMVKNDGERTNEEAFWPKFSDKMGRDCRRDEAVFREFYENEFEGARDICGYEPAVLELISFLKENRIKIVLATNPIFPAVATFRRIGWAGLKPEDFELITTYENSKYCKPNPRYYIDLMEKMGTEPDECIMVGNDVDEDMIPCEKCGMQVFLLQDNLINRGNVDISKYNRGGFKELFEFLKNNILQR